MRPPKDKSAKRAKLAYFPANPTALELGDMCVGGNTHRIAPYRYFILRQMVRAPGAYYSWRYDGRNIDVSTDVENIIILAHPPLWPPRTALILARLRPLIGAHLQRDK